VGRRIAVGGPPRTFRCYQYPDIEAFLEWKEDHNLAAVLIETPFAKSAPYEMRRREREAIRALFAEWSRSPDFDPVVRGIRKLIDDRFKRESINPYSDRAITAEINRKLKASGITISRAEVRGIVRREKLRLDHYRAVAWQAAGQVRTGRRSKSRR
jgi:hypothetical protein